MTKFMQGIAIGLLACICFSSALALNTHLKIPVSYRDIKLFVDDEIITPKDAEGNVVEPFIYDGTTYLPVRAVGEALGRDVDWDNETSTVVITGKPVKKIFLAEKEFIYRSTTRISSMKNGDITQISVNPEGGGVDLRGVYLFEEKITYELNGLAERIVGKIPPPTTVGNGQADCRITFLDENDKVLFETKVTAPNSFSEAIEFDIDLKSKQKLTVVFDGMSSYKHNKNLNIKKSCVFNVEVMGLYTTDY